MKLKHLLGIGAGMAALHVAAPHVVMQAARAQTYVYDPLTPRTAGNALDSAVTPNSTGATWTLRQGSGGAVFSSTSRLRNGSTSGEALYVPSGSAGASASYDAYFDVRIPDTSSGIWALDGGITPASGTDNRNDLVFNVGAAGNVYARKIAAGAATNEATTTLSVADITPSGTAAYRIKYSQRVNTPSAGQTTITWSVAPYPGTSFTQIASYTDASPQGGMGYVGLDFGALTTASDISGPQVEEVQQVAPGATPAAMRGAGRTYAVNDPALSGAFTPQVWQILPVQGSSQYPAGTYEAVDTLRGGEADYQFTGGSLAIPVDTSYYASAPSSQLPVLAVSVDDGPEQDFQEAAGQTSIPVAVPSAYPSGQSCHTFHLTFVEVGALFGYGLSRYKSAGSDGAPYSLRIAGFTVDSGATISAAPLPSNYMVLLGDSISEDDFSNPSTAALFPALNGGRGGDTRTTYAYNLGAAFGLREIRLAAAGSGALATAGDDVAPADTLLNNYDNAHSRSWAALSPSVQMFVINHNTNDQGYTDAAVQAADQTLYTDCLTKFPAAQGYILVPFGQAKAAAITAAVAAVNSPRLHLINLGAAGSIGLSYGGASYQSVEGTHPNTITHAKLGEEVVQEIQQAKTAVKRKVQ